MTTCCDAKNLKSLENGVALAANFLSRCPSCLDNFARVICEMTCSSKQSVFLEPVKFDVNDKGKPSVKEINYYITNDLINRVFNSCKYVSVPSTGQLALDLMCGSWGASKCNAQRWYNFLGTKENNPYVPFQINYKYEDGKPLNEFTPLNVSTTPCNKALNVSILNCHVGSQLAIANSPKEEDFRSMGV